MPTTITRYVNTASTPGGNGTTNATGSGDANRAYASLQAAEAALRKNLVTSDELLEIVCDAPTGVADTGSVTFSNTNWTTDATRYIYIKVAPGNEATAAGWKTDRYRLQGNNVLGSTLDVRVHLIAENLQIANYNVNNNNNPRGVSISSYVWLIGCRVETTSLNFGSQHPHPINVFLSYGRIINCMIKSNTRNGYPNTIPLNAAGIHILNYATNNTYIYNTTIANVPHGVFMQTYAAPNNTGPVYAKNVLVTDISGSCFITGSNYSGNWGSGATNNASTDGTAPGTSARTNQTFTFVDSASGDYRLASTDTGAINYGADLSADSFYPFSNDIERNTRAGTWDIGAFEYISTAVSNFITSFVKTATSKVSLSKTGSPVSIRGS